jgi:hypothetical protein
MGRSRKLNARRCARHSGGRNPKTEAKDDERAGDAVQRPGGEHQIFSTYHEAFSGEA